MASEEDYGQTSCVRFMHRLPRFGHSSDFYKLASSDQNEQTDYAVGLLAVSFFILSLFVFWAATIITLKCMGKQRVGLCAGQARVVSDAKGNFVPPSYLWKVRCAFMLLGCCMILLCATLVGPGIRSVTSTSISIRRSNRDVKDLITRGLLIMDSVQRVKWTFDDYDVESKLSSQGVESVCPNLSDKDLRSSLRQVRRDFVDLREYLDQSDMEDLRSHIDTILDTSDSVDSVVTIVEENDWAIRMFALIVNVLVFFMIFASATSSGRRCPKIPALRWMAELFILPSFAILIAISWLITSGIAFASISSADFCVGSPQQSGPSGTLMSILEERGIAEGDMIHDAVTYYQSGCSTEDPIQHLYKYEDEMQSGIESASDFQAYVEDVGIDEINRMCGGSARRIIEGIGLVKDNLGILLSALRSAFELAECMNVSPKFEQVFEVVACSELSGSLSLVFSIMFAINVVGLLMINLRASMYPYKKAYDTSSIDEDEDEWEEYQAYLRYMSSFVNRWSGDMTEEDAAASKSTKDTFTASGSSGTSDEETPLSPRTPALDEEQISYVSSMDEAPDPFGVYTPKSQKIADWGWEESSFVDQKFGALSSVEVTSPRRRRMPHGEIAYYNRSPVLSPQNATSGTNADGDRRRVDVNTVDMHTSNKLPETPLMTSPKSNSEEKIEVDIYGYIGDIITPSRGVRTRKDD